MIIEPTIASAQEHIVLIIASVFLIAIACQWFAWWVKLPAILFLLLAGILVGPVTQYLRPDDLLGDLLFPFVSLSVAVILFEGALSLKAHEIKGFEKVLRRMITTGMLTTWIITTLATKYLLGFSWELSFLFGAVTVVTGPTVIVPMLRTIRPNTRIANILRWEGIIIDPIGAMLAVLTFEFIKLQEKGGALTGIIGDFFVIILTGIIMGLLFGYLFGLVLRHHLLPEFLHNVATLSFVFVAFALSNMLYEDSGLLTVTIMGLLLANMKNVPVEDILDFKESLSVILISVLFIVLAARIEFSQLRELGLPAIGVFLIMQFVARPLKIAFSTFGSSLTFNERLLLSWIAPRGIVAAAVSALFALRMEQAGYEHAELLVPLTFMIIIGTVVLESATAGKFGQWLDVAEPNPNGFLIIGANVVARTIAKELVENGFSATLVDSNWENIKKVRMEGLEAYYGNPISDHADRHLDLVGVGRMLAITPFSDFNTLACTHYRVEFGRKNIFAIKTNAEAASSEKHQAGSQHKVYTLFSEDITYSTMANMIHQGAEIRSTKLTDEFGFDDYIAKNEGKISPLFAINSKGKIGVFVAEGVMKPEAGWTIMSLVPTESSLSSEEVLDKS